MRTYKITIIYDGGHVAMLGKKEEVRTSIIPRKDDILLTNVFGKITVKYVCIDFREIPDGNFSTPCEDIYVYVEKA